MAADLGEGTSSWSEGRLSKCRRRCRNMGVSCGNACFVLESYGRQTGLGYALSNDSAVVTERGPDTVRGADVSFYSHARWPRSEVGNRLPPVPPDLAVEVVSPGNRPGEMLKKVSEYLEAGVSMVWVVYPQATSCCCVSHR